MARTARTQAGFDILEDTLTCPGLDQPGHLSADQGDDDCPALSDVTETIDNSQNIAPPDPIADSLAAELEKFHIQTAKKSTIGGILRTNVARGQHTRPPIGADTFVPPQESPKHKHAHFDLPSLPTTPPAGSESDSVSESEPSPEPAQGSFSPTPNPLYPIPLILDP